MATDSDLPVDASSASAPREPGAPIPKGEIDPELVSLRPRTQVGLLTAFSIVVFCAFLAVRLMPDFTFSREGKAQPVEVAAIIGGKVSEDRNVRVELDLERAAAIRVRVSSGVPGLRLAPVVGTADAMWVAIDGDGWAHPRSERTYIGRLRRLSELPFDAPMRAYARAHPAPRFVSAEELRTGKTADASSLGAVTGDAFQVEPDDVVELVVADPDAVMIIGSFGTRVPDAEAWTTQLNGAFAAGGAQDYRVELRRADSHQAWFDVHYPGARATAPKLLERAKLWGGRVEPITVRHRAAYENVTVTPAALTIGDATLPWASVDVIAIHAARPIPGDPWVLLADEVPAQYWYLTTVYVLLAIFALLFGWALVRTARRELMAPKVPTRA